MAAALSSSSSSLREHPRFVDTSRAAASAFFFKTPELGKSLRPLSICHVAATTPVVANSSGLQKCCHVSEELQKIVGEAELPRNQVLKQVWVYIKGNNLQNPEKKSEILCDETMARVFGVDKMGFMDVNKYLSEHLTYEGSTGPKRPRSPKREEVLERNKKQIAAIRSRSSGSITGFTKPVRISNALRHFLGAAEAEFPRSEVVKRLWSYIKENKLQDENDKRRIVCDAKLRNLLNTDSFVGITMTAHLKPHFLKDS